MGRNLTLCLSQGRDEVRWRPGQETSLAPPCVQIVRFFGGKCTALTKVLVILLGIFGAPVVIWRTGNYASFAPPLLLPWSHIPALEKLSYQGNWPNKHACKLIILLMFLAITGQDCLRNDLSFRSFRKI